jgi:hypothetical protein
MAAEYRRGAVMNFGLRVLAMCSAALLLVGCATPTPMQAGAQAAIHSVAVVSLVPEEVPLQIMGFTVFNNHSSRLAVSPRTVIEGAIGDRIGQDHPDWTVKPISYDRAALLEQATNLWVSGWPSAQNIHDALAKLASQAAADAIIVVTPTEYNPDDTGGSGVGVWGRNIPLLHFVIVYANVGMEVVDAHGTVLARAQERHPLDAYHLYAEREHISLDWPLDPELRARLESMLRAELGYNIRTRMSEVGL